jgi:hypothetical protein
MTEIKYEYLSSDKRQIVGEIGASHQHVFEHVRISLDTVYYTIFNITIIDIILLV